jgi:hypothetical protein
VSITDDIIDKARGEGKKMEAVKVTAHYGADTQVEIWFEGPHAATGMVLDFLLGYTSSEPELTSLTVTPNPKDIPGLSGGE